MNHNIKLNFGEDWQFNEDIITMNAQIAHEYFQAFKHQGKKANDAIEYGKRGKESKNKLLNSQQLIVLLSVHVISSRKVEHEATFTN